MSQKEFQRVKVMENIADRIRTAAAEWVAPKNVLSDREIWREITWLF